MENNRRSKNKYSKSRYSNQYGSNESQYRDLHKSRRRRSPDEDYQQRRRRSRGYYDYEDNRYDRHNYDRRRAIESPCRESYNRHRSRDQYTNEYYPNDHSHDRHKEYKREFRPSKHKLEYNEHVKSKRSRIDDQFTQRASRQTNYSDMSDLNKEYEHEVIFDEHDYDIVDVITDNSTNKDQKELTPKQNGKSPKGKHIF